MAIFSEQSVTRKVLQMGNLQRRNAIEEEEEKYDGY